MDILNIQETDSAKNKGVSNLLFSFLHISVLHYWSGAFRMVEQRFYGYWFTIVLFDMFVIYYVTTFTSKLIKRDVSLPLMSMFALVGPALIHFGITDEGLFGTVLGTTNLCFFMQWFVLGLIVKNIMADLTKSCQAWRSKPFSLYYISCYYVLTMMR